jgi:hypothetical protein
MNIFSHIAEQRIRAAIENGEFDNLKNKGRPVHLEDETWIREDIRVAYRLLKSSGYMPPELELRNEIMNLQELMHTIDDDKERLKKIRALNFKLLKLNELRKRPFTLEDFPEYEDKLHTKLRSSSQF